MGAATVLKLVSYDIKTEPNVFQLLVFDINKLLSLV